jgi:GNAT superfamily N-acetyltransferase
MIEYKIWKAQELNEYIHSDDLRVAEHVAITPQRAMSHLHNPKIQTDDVLMITAWHEKKLVAYLGFLPDDYVTEDNKNIHLAWMSCLWVHPMQRGKKIAAKLLHKAFEVWNHKLLLTEFTFEAGQLYQKSQLFREVFSFQGKRWYLRACSSLVLPAKATAFGKIWKVLRVVDRVANFFIDLKNTGYNENLAHFNAIRCTHVDKEIQDFLYSFVLSGFQRGAIGLEWMIEHPWIVQSPKKDDISLKYHFSSSEPEFEFILIKHLDQNHEINGILLAQVRNGHLKIPYLYSHDIPQSADIVLHLLKIYKVSILTLFNQNLINELTKHGLKGIYNKEILRNYMLSNHPDLECIKLDNFSFQDGDGDCAFT